VTTTTHRALVRVHNAAARLVQAVSALKARDQSALPLLAKLLVWPAWLAAWLLARSLRTVALDYDRQHPCPEKPTQEQAAPCPDGGL